MIRRTTRAALLLSLAALSPAAFAADDAPSLSFKPQEIDKSLKVGYAVRVADINNDGKQDIVVCDSARVIWFSNPDWKLHTVIENKDAGVKADNVCIAIADIDGDKKLDIALGADWQPNNTTAAGSLQWLKQPDDLSKPWQVFPIKESMPTLHRINFGDLNGDNNPELLVAPLKGVGATAKAQWADAGVALTAFQIPEDPQKGPWKPFVITDRFHVMHNFLPVQWGLTKAEQILVASYEGVHLLVPGANEWDMWKLGEGNQTTPTGNRGSSEIKWGKLKDGRKILATVEPFHGTQAVAYVQPTSALKSDDPWPRTVLDETLTGGHAVWCADFDGDGTDEIVIGWRDVLAGKPPTGIRIFKVSGNADAIPTWSMMQLDKGEIACEDVACADFDGDGDMDIVGVGRKTQNVKIYWNQTPQKK